MSPLLNIKTYNRAVLEFLTIWHVGRMRSSQIHLLTLKSHYGNIKNFEIYGDGSADKVSVIYTGRLNPYRKVYQPTSKAGRDSGLLVIPALGWLF